MKLLSQTFIEEYKYNTEEERQLHVKYMESQGYECGGQVRKSDDSIYKEDREYYWYAKFVKQI